MNKPKIPEAIGESVGERLARTISRMPGTGDKNTPYGYTSEAEIREKVESIIKAPTRKISAKQMELVGLEEDPVLKAHAAKKFTPEERKEIGEKWIQRLIVNARKQSRLMSDQQLSDWRLGRKLVVGDKCRYIGPTRNEITQADLIVPRPHGQEGFITSVMDSQGSRILTFQPSKPTDAVKLSEAKDAQYVALQVREHTQGWLHLERMPDGVDNANTSRARLDEQDENFEESP